MWNPFKKEHYVKALVFYPNKMVKMIKVKGNNNTFGLREGGEVNRYVVDQKATYFYKNEPLLVYHSGHASPIMVEENADLAPSMTSGEFQSIIKTNAVRDLLTAAVNKGWDLHFIASVVAAVCGVLLLVTSGGLSGLIPGGG